MPLVLPLAVIAAALASFILLYVYEQLFGSPLDGLAQHVPVVGKYIARGVDSAVSYGKGIVSGYVDKALHTIVSWLEAFASTVKDLADALNAYLVDLPDDLDHLTHVTVHDIVKAFVNPVRAVAQSAQDDANAALSEVAAVGHTLTADVQAVEQDIARETGHVLSTIRQVDLPDFRHAIEVEIGAAAGTLGGEIDDLRDWAGGWIEQLQDLFNQIPLQDLIDGAAAGTLAYTLARTIADEAGLDSPGCRAKVKGICGTDAGAWTHLLEGLVPLFALPSLVDLVGVAQDIAGEVAEGVTALAGR